MRSDGRPEILERITPEPLQDGTPVRVIGGPANGDLRVVLFRNDEVLAARFLGAAHIRRG